MRPSITKVPGTVPDADLSVRIPQVAHRARAYKLEDNGASDQAQRKRWAKGSIRTSKYFVSQIRLRQEGRSSNPPYPPEVAERLIQGHLDHIEEVRQKIRDSRPTAPLIAPVSRRVAREDRRRRRAASQNQKQRNR